MYIVFLIIIIFASREHSKTLNAAGENWDLLGMNGRNEEMCDNKDGKTIRKRTFIRNLRVR